MTAESGADAPKPLLSPLPSIGRALRHRNYRLFFAGQSISLVGTWLTRVATSWLVYRLTGSALCWGSSGSPARSRPSSWRRWRACGSIAGTATASWW